MRNVSADFFPNWLWDQKTHRVHGEAGSVPVQRGAQLLQLVVDTVSLPERQKCLRHHFVSERIPTNITSPPRLSSLTRFSISRLPGWNFPCPGRGGSCPSLSSAFFPPPPVWRYRRDHSQGSTGWSRLASCAWTSRGKCSNFKNVASRSQQQTLECTDRKPVMQQKVSENTRVAFRLCELSNYSYHLVRVSWMALVRAWPRWSDPVTFGGGIHIMKMPRGFCSLILFLCGSEGDRRGVAEFNDSS